MRVGDSVRLTIDMWEADEHEAAMLHACTALDGTARKQWPGLRNRERFTRLLRENYDVLGSMGAPGIDLQATRWPVHVQKPKADTGGADFADVMYGVHRCTQGHGDVLPDGFELLLDARGPSGITRMAVVDGAVQMSDRVLFGLLAAAVLSQANAGQSVPDGYCLSYVDRQLPINDLWGRRAEFQSVLNSGPKLPTVVFDFGDWPTKR